MGQEGQCHPVVAAAESIHNKIKTEIVLGSPREGCNGAGLCRIIPYGQPLNDIRCPKTTAWISISPEKRVSVLFLTSSLDEQTVARHFPRSGFVITDTFLMPKSVLRKLGTRVAVSIQPGVYPVRRSAEFLAVTF